MTRAPHFPYRVIRRSDPTGPPLTATQRRVLAALVHLCPKPGSDVPARAVSRASGVKLGATVVILQSLTTKRLVTHYSDGPDKPIWWTPTLTGRARARNAAAFRADGAGRREFATDAEE